MDKYLITAFKSEVAAAILNSQKTDNNLNPNADAYIDEEELPAVLEFFGKTDVRELLATADDTPSDSVFDQTETSDEPEINADKFTSLSDSNNAVLRNDGSAAYELQNSIASDLQMTTAAGTPFSAQMSNLYETRKALLKKHEDTSDIDAKIEALNEAAKEYIKTNQTDVTKDLIDKGAVKTFKFGKNDEKTGYFVQTFDIKGGTTKNGSDNTVENTAATETDNAETNDNDDSQAGYNIKYGIEVLTDKLHAIANVEAGSENSDIQGAVVYNNQISDNKSLNFSGNFRQTIEKDNNQTFLGTAIDYRTNKFSAGAYGCYKIKQVDSEKYKNLAAEAHAKYGKSIRVATGYEQEKSDDTNVRYSYVNAKLSGNRELKNVSLSGSVEGKYGITKMDSDAIGNNITLPDYEVIAKGGITFTSDKLKTNIYANAGIMGGKEFMVNTSDNGELTFSKGKNQHTILTTLVGNISTDAIDVTATLAGTNSPQYYFNSNDNDDNTKMPTQRTWGYSSSITVSPKKVFGKDSKIAPSVTYSVSNNEDIQHYVGLNLGINI